MQEVYVAFKICEIFIKQIKKDKNEPLCNRRNLTSYNLLEQNVFIESVKQFEMAIRFANFLYGVTVNAEDLNLNGFNFSKSSTAIEDIQKYLGFSYANENAHYTYKYLSKALCYLRVVRMAYTKFRSFAGSNIHSSLSFDVENYFSFAYIYNKKSTHRSRVYNRHELYVPPVCAEFYRTAVGKVENDKILHNSIVEYWKEHGQQDYTAEMKGGKKQNPEKTSSCVQENKKEGRKLANDVSVAKEENVMCDPVSFIQKEVNKIIFSLAIPGVEKHGIKVNFMDRNSNPEEDSLLFVNILGKSVFINSGTYEYKIPYGYKFQDYNRDYGVLTIIFVKKEETRVNII